MIQRQTVCEWNFRSWPYFKFLIVSNLMASSMASFFRSALKVSAIVLLGSVLSGKVAQANDASSLQSIGTESSSDPFSSRGDNTSGMMQMIHRVMQGESNVDQAEQRAAQKENLNEATSDFFTKQRDRLKATLSKPSASQSAAIGTPQPLVLMPTSPSSALGSSGLITPILQPGPADTLVILAPTPPTK